MSKYKIERRGARWAIYGDDGIKVFSHYDRLIVERQLARLENKQAYENQSKNRL